MNLSEGSAGADVEDREEAWVEMQDLPQPEPQLVQPAASEANLPTIAAAGEEQEARNAAEDPPQAEQRRESDGLNNLPSVLDNDVPSSAGGSRGEHSEMLEREQQTEEGEEAASDLLSNIVTLEIESVEEGITEEPDPTPCRTLGALHGKASGVDAAAHNERRASASLDHFPRISQLFETLPVCPDQPGAPEVDGKHTASSHYFAAEDENGDCYFVNLITWETVWDLPEGGIMVDAPESWQLGQ
jgi:hypothetical protein